MHPKGSAPTSGKTDTTATPKENPVFKTASPAGSFMTQKETFGSSSPQNSQLGSFQNSYIKRPAPPPASAKGKLSISTKEPEPSKQTEPSKEPDASTEAPEGEGEGEWYPDAESLIDLKEEPDAWTNAPDVQNKDEKDEDKQKPNADEEKPSEDEDKVKPDHEEKQSVMDDEAPKEEVPAVKMNTKQSPNDREPADSFLGELLQQTAKETQDLKEKQPTPISTKSGQSVSKASLDDLMDTIVSDLEDFSDIIKDSPTPSTSFFFFAFTCS